MLLASAGHEVLASSHGGLPVIFQIRLNLTPTHGCLEMHERTRRQLCRLLFCLLVLAPTGWVGGTICYRASSWGAGAIRADREARLTDHLGLQTRIGRVWQPAPGVEVYEQVAFHDPDGEQRIASLQVLELSTGNGHRSWEAMHVEIEPGQLGLLLERLHERLLRGPAGLTSGEFYAREITLRGSQQGQTLSNLWALAAEGETGPQVTIEFQVAGIDMPTPAELRVVRNRQANPAVTGWQLRTGSRPLPCSLLVDYLPQLGSLGPQAAFVGSVWVERSPSGWHGDVVGTIHKLSLGDLLEPFPHKLTGTAEVELKRARFREGKLTEMAGRVHSPGGVVSRSFITGLEESFRVVVQGLPKSDQSRLLTYRELGAAFELDHTGLRLTGACASQPHMLLLFKDAMRIEAPPAEPIPAVSLARMLLPQSEFQVPLARQTDFLFRALPLPSSIAPSAATANSYAPLRLRR